MDLFKKVVNEAYISKASGVFIGGDILEEPNIYICSVQFSEMKRAVKKIFLTHSEHRHKKAGNIPLIPDDLVDFPRLNLLFPFSMLLHRFLGKF